MDVQTDRILNPAHNPKFEVLKSILILLSHLHISLPSALVCSGFSTKSLISASSLENPFPCSVQSSPSNISWRAQWRNFTLHVLFNPLVTSSLSPSFSSPSYSQTPSIYIFLLGRDTKFYKHVKQQIKLHYKKSFEYIGFHLGGMIKDY